MNITPHISRLLLGALLASAVVLSARPAHADDTPRIFPLVPTSRIPQELSGTPEALTEALATLLDGETTDRSLEDFGKKLRCDIEISTCLDRIARSLATSQLVYGTLKITIEGKVRVKLVRFDSAKSGSELFQRSFTLSEKTPRRLGKALARSAAQMFDRELPEEGDPPKPKPKPTPPTTTPPVPTPPAPTEPIEPTEPTPPVIETTPTPEPAPTADEPSGGRITKGTWALIGSGALIAAGGGGFLYSARDLRDQIQAAPRATAADLIRLTELERAYKLRDRIGTGLAVGGGAVLAVGLMRALAQRDSDPQESKPSLSLVPVSGGAAVVFSGDLR